MKQEIIRIDLGSVNCYLLKKSGSFILVDTGGHITLDKEFSNRRQLLENELEKAGCRPGNLKLVILTHGDNDHVANAAYIREKYNVKILMHPGDIELVREPGMEKAMESFQFRSIVYKIIFKLMKNKLIGLTAKVLDDYEGFSPDILVDESLSLKDYGFEADVIHLPGHTAGSIGIVTAERDLISGDTLANIKKPEIAINATDFKVLRESVSRLKSMGIKTVYPGHGTPFEFKEIRK